MYYSYLEIEYVAMSFSPARTDLALKLLRVYEPMSSTHDHSQGFVVTAYSGRCPYLQSKRHIVIPSEPPVNVPKRMDLPVLGTEIDDIADLDKKYLANEEQF